jgi:hypothetical protein
VGEVDTMEAIRGDVRTIVAVGIALGLGVVGVAQASYHPPPLLAQTAAKKKRHKLSLQYKTSPVDVIDEPSPGTAVFSDEAKLTGRPLGSRKAHVDEQDVFTFNVPEQIPRSDYSGTHQVFFKAEVFGYGTFSGSYGYSVDAEGNPSTAITGVIDGGKGRFRGAKGSFTVTDLVAFHTDPVQYRAQWTGSIRY